jgi:hypothetical protein
VPPRITDSRAKLFLFFLLPILAVSLSRNFIIRIPADLSSASWPVSDLIRAAPKQNFFSRDNAKKVTAANGAQEKRTIQPNR